MTQGKWGGANNLPGGPVARPRWDVHGAWSATPPVVSSPISVLVV